VLTGILTGDLYRGVDRECLLWVFTGKREFLFLGEKSMKMMCLRLGVVYR
jgi:hypothetical protein